MVASQFCSLKSLRSPTRILYSAPDEALSSDKVISYSIGKAAYIPYYIIRVEYPYIMRSGSGLYIVIGILVVALLAFGGYTLTKNQSSPGTVINTGSPTPSVQNNSTEKSTPTTSKNKEDAVSLQGEVISYSECRVGPCPVGSMYMVIQPENDKEFGFDIYPETKIYFGDAVIVHISSIKVGQQVSVKGRTIDTAGPEDQTIADEVRILKST